MWNTPYEIPGGNNKDNSPLIKQWPNPLSESMPKNNMMMQSPILLRLLERFPILQRLLDQVSNFRDQTQTIFNF